MHFYLVDDDNSSKVIVAHSKDEAWRVASQHDFGDPVEPEAFYEITMLAPNHYKKAQIIVEER